jgi:hypothetical protein
VFASATVVGRGQEEDRETGRSELAAGDAVVEPPVRGVWRRATRMAAATVVLRIIVAVGEAAQSPMDEAIVLASLEAASAAARSSLTRRGHPKERTEYLSSKS